jgi:hypothetical protein
MDLKQTKLTRGEWDSIEIPVSEGEKEILSLIMEGFDNLDITKNKTMSLFAFTKIEKTTENEGFLYSKYFDSIIQRTFRKFGDAPIMKKLISSHKGVSGGPLKKMKSVDLLRIQNLESNIESNKKLVFEFLVLEFYIPLFS